MKLRAIIQEFLTAKTADGRAEATLRDYRRVLSRLAEHVDADVATWTRATVRGYVASLRTDTDWAEGTINLHIRYLRSFWGWLYREQLTDEDFSQAVAAPKKSVSSEDLLTEAEIKRLLLACQQCSAYPERDTALILTLMDTGVRRGELVLMQRDKVHFEDGQAWALIEAPKTADSRYVIWGATSARALRSYLATRQDDDPALWYGEQGPLGYYAFHRILRRRAEDAGIDKSKVHPHAFRKLFATWWIRNGGDEQRLMKLGGWSGPDMLRIYVQLGNLDALRDGHEDYSPVESAAWDEILEGEI